MGRDGAVARDRRRRGARARYDQLAGLSAAKARTKIVEMLKESGDLIGDPRPITHNVKFFEKGDRPLEIITSRQWFIRTMDIREELVKRGDAIEWHPAYMRTRFENWVNGLNGDWCISRQRFFGVPFPVWYRVNADGTTNHSDIKVPEESRLPMDPSTDAPAGFTNDQRGQPGGFVGDPDVMDTWATSSLTPFIVCGWGGRDPELWKKTFPMHLRPQGHDIIRTWLFSTVLRSHLEENALPWTNAAISGWVLDPDRKKMSKSRGNVITPMHLLDEYGSDAVRYWAAKGGPGVDTAFDVGQMKVGRRLAIKLLNASKFVLMKREPIGPVTEALDRGMLHELAGVVGSVTKHMDGYDYGAALRETEAFFWTFCDDYIELVKRRRRRRRCGRGIGKPSRAVGALDHAAAVRAVPAVCDRRSVVVDARGIHPSHRVADRSRGRRPSRSRVAGFDVVWLNAKEITAQIRHQRSSKGFGFGVPVNAKPARCPPPSRKRGRSSVERRPGRQQRAHGVETTFAIDRFDVTIEPVAPDA